MNLRRSESDSISYSNIMLAGTNKRGELKKLDNGYYEIIIGAFAAYGNGGWFYDLASAKRYIETDNDFIHRIQSGQMHSEWGHPVRTPGMTDQEWFTRIHTLYEPNWSSHIRRIRLDMNTVKDDRGRYVVAVIGEVCPSGPKASEFRLQLENPHIDVNYSIRSFARQDSRNMTKHINRIITWDNVFSPGIKVASKYNTPSMENSLDLSDPKSVALHLDNAEWQIETEFNLSRLRKEFDSNSSSDISLESSNQMVKIIDSLWEDNRKVFGNNQPKSSILKW